MRFALEGNLTYQHDTRASVPKVYALNVILHLFFETRHARKTANQGAVGVSPGTGGISGNGRRIGTTTG